MRAIAVPPSKQLLIVIVIVKLARRSVLLKNLNDLKWVIVEEIEKLGYTAEIFTTLAETPGLASARSWHPRDADEIARRCSTWHAALEIHGLAWERCFATD
jgi:hypothetical protein